MTGDGRDAGLARAVSSGGTVRDATPADLPALRAIQLAALSEPSPALLDSGVRGPMPVLVIEESTRAATVRAERSADVDASNANVVGYALAVVGEKTAYLAELAVAPGYRGAGRGTALLNALVGRLRTDGVTGLRVTVLADDEQARSFYRSHGFRTCERLSGQFDDGDAFLLERSLA